MFSSEGWTPFDKILFITFMDRISRRVDGVLPLLASSGHDFLLSLRWLTAEREDGGIQIYSLIIPPERGEVLRTAWAFPFGRVEASQGFFFPEVRE